MKHLLTARALTAKIAASLFERAAQFEADKARIATLPTQTVVTVFFEESTRTRFSFEAAARRLGAQVLSFSPATSSVKKGESLLDTIQNLLAIVQAPSTVVLRHPATGAAQFLAEHLTGISVVNAGDGTGEHPTQALLDAWTLTRSLGSIAGKKILIVGDIAHSRVAHSNIVLLNTLGAKITLCGPGHLVPRGYSDQVVIDLDFDRALAATDAVICVRVQQNRHREVVLPDLAEYRRFWGLTEARANKLRPDVPLLAPGPVNYDVEIDASVGRSPRSLILKQTSNGVWMRMAVLAALKEAHG